MILSLNQPTSVTTIIQASTVVLLIIYITLIDIAKSSLDPVQEARCLDCIRNVSVSLGTDVSKRCEGYYCGHYQLSYTYWAEAGKPGNNQGSRDYEKCARDKTCAEQAVRGYFKKFKRDCNNDGQIDCLDMAALHKAGPTSCTSDWFYKSRFWLAFNKTSCMTNREEMSDSSRSDYEDHSVARQPPVRLMKNQSLTPECLDCICDAVSGCNTSVNNCGSGTVCGPFAISQAYWKDGKRPGSSWTTCARTKECSSVAMKNYMEKYKRDCNDDGYITCEDYAAIHRRGPRACSNKDLLKDHYWNKFLACRANQKPVKDVNMVKVDEDDSNISPVTTLPSIATTTVPANSVQITNSAAEQNVPSGVGGSSSSNNPFTVIGSSNAPTPSTNTYSTAMGSTASGSGSVSSHFEYSQTPRYDMTVPGIQEQVNNKDESSQQAVTVSARPSVLQRFSVGNSDHHHYHHHHHHHHHQPPSSASTTSHQDDSTDSNSKHRYESTSEMMKQESSQEYRPFVPTSPAHHEQTIFSSRPNDYDPSSATIVTAQGLPQTSQLSNNWPPAPPATTTMTSTTPSSTTTSTTTTTTTTTTTATPVSLKAQPATTTSDATYMRTETPILQSSSQQQQQQQRPTSIDSLSTINDDMNSPTISGHEQTSNMAHPGDMLINLGPQSNQNSQQTGIQDLQPMLGGVTGGGDEIDYSDVYTNQGGGMRAISPDRTSNFDKTVIDIVSNKDFSKSYPPVPDLNGLDRQTEASPLSLQADELNAGSLLGKLPSKATIGAGTSSKGPGRPDMPSRTTVNNMRNNNQLPIGLVTPAQVVSPSAIVSPTSVSTSPIYTRSTVGQQAEYQQPPMLTSQQPPPLPPMQTTKATQEVASIQNDNRMQDLAPIFGSNDSMNLTGLFDKALNESSRIASECLECICDASSNCDTSVQCISKQREKNRCGLYMISWNQFQESDISLTALVLGGASGDGGADEPADEKMYYDCTTDRVCAEKLIHLYIEKHQRDCNNDGKIDCYDIAAIHRVGPENCNSGKFLGSQYWKDFNICYTTDRLTTTAQPQASAQLFQ